MKRELRLRLNYPTVGGGHPCRHRENTPQGGIMLWIKAFHIVFVTSWFAGLFYLPRIFVNLAMVPADSHAERERLLLMAGKLYRFITPLGVLGDRPRPLAVVRLRLFRRLAARQDRAGDRPGIAYHALVRHACSPNSADGSSIGRSHVWFRFFNEVPVLALVAVCILVVVKPF
jgi:putative membrane protein